ncbi:hypothetical protein BEN74_11965 [Acinetobacter sp. WCHAc010034]|nr:hypothetical protein BEN74_11965 [Acinetobacter sp. WCHAc010034]
MARHGRHSAGCCRLKLLFQFIFLTTWRTGAEALAGFFQAFSARLFGQKGQSALFFLIFVRPYLF